MREVSGIGLSYNVYNYIDGYGYSEYVCSYSYQGKLNGTKATFNDYNTSTTSVAISLLDDAKIVQNTEINFYMYNAYSYSYYAVRNAIGAVSACSYSSNYSITNVTLNLSFSGYSANLTGYIGGLFGILNQTANITNVTDKSNFNAGIGSVGGLIAEFSGSNVTMTNVALQGQYISNGGSCGCVIGAITLSSSTTSLINCSINASMSSLSSNSGPVYGENQGTTAQLDVPGTITLSQSSVFNNCPIGSGTISDDLQSEFADKCPAKSEILELQINSFTCGDTVQQNTHHCYFQLCYAIDNSMDVNNTNLQITMGSMGMPYENRSIFDRKASYENVTIMVLNDANMSWGSGQYGFSYIQSLVDDTTVSISNVVIQATAYGNYNGQFGGFAQCLSSNLTVSNITINISKLYFQYAAGFVYALNSTNVTLTNMQINLTNAIYGSYYYMCGFVYYVHSYITSFTVQNSQINVTRNQTEPMAAFVHESKSSSCAFTFSGVNVTMHKQDTQSSSYFFLINTLNGSSCSFDNCSFDIDISYSNSFGGVFGTNYISGYTNYTNCNATGTMEYTSSSYSYYYQGGLEGYLYHGSGRTVTNTTIQMNIDGSYQVGGLFGYAYGSKTVLIDQTTVDVSLTASANGAYLGGFFGYIGSSSVSATITNSQFSNGNGNSNVGCLVGAGSAYSPTVDNEEETCPTTQLIELSSTPTQSTSYTLTQDPEHTSYSVYPCYWTNSTFDSDGSGIDLNYTTFNITYTSAPSTCGYQYGSWVLSIFPYGFYPPIARNIQTVGTIRLQSWYHVMITLAVYDDTSSTSTLYSNIKLSHTNQEVSSADYAFSMAGLIWKVQGTGNISFSNCVNEVIHNHNLTGYNSTTCGFVLYATSYFTLDSCTSNYTVYDYYYTDSYEAGTTKYAVGKYLNGGCDATSFESDWTTGLC